MVKTAKKKQVKKAKKKVAKKITPKKGKKVAKKITPKKGAKKTTKKKVQQNILFPGRPNYKGPVEGYFAMLHHDTLQEHSYNVAERVDYVKSVKSKDQVKTRLHNMLYLGPTEKRRHDVLTLVKKHIPDHAWLEGVGEMKLNYR